MGGCACVRTGSGVLGLCLGSGLGWMVLGRSVREEFGRDGQLSVDLDSNHASVQLFTVVAAAVVRIRGT